MYVVIPCYNEEQMLPITAKALIKKLDELKAEGRIAQNSKVMFVDDGSKDKTWEIIQKLHEASPVFTGLKLSRNKGHQNALLAGLMTARNYADIIVSMDADLQDDINAIDGFLDNDGSEPHLERCRLYQGSSLDQCFWHVCCTVRTYHDCRRDCRIFFDEPACLRCAAGIHPFSVLLGIFL